MPTRELIGLDIGSARTGLARASAVARLAEPINSVSTETLLDELKKLLDKTEVEAVVVGLPRNLQGEDTGQTKWVRRYVERLKTELEIPFFWQDEALTSKHAQVLSSQSKGKFDEHSLAASIILQDWIDTPESKRVRC